jgi:hypothetical protein
MGIAATVLSGGAGPGILIFGAADLTYSGWLPKNWAWMQTVFGGGLNLIAGISYAYMARPHGGLSQFRSTCIALAAVHGTFGIWFTTHGILSLKYYKPKPRLVSWLPSVAPTRDGVLVIAGGFF